MYRRSYKGAGKLPPVERPPEATEEKRGWFAIAMLGFAALLVVISVAAQLMIIDELMLDRYYPARGWGAYGGAMLMVVVLMYFVAPVTVLSFIMAITFSTQKPDTAGRKAGLAIFWLGALLPLATYLVLALPER